MKLSIVFVLFFGYFCHGSDIWYQAEMSTWFVPPFQYAYTILQTNVLTKLSTIDANSLSTRADAPTALATNMYCEVDKLIRALDVSVTSSNNIRIKVDQKLATLTSEIAAKEKEVAQTNAQIQSMNGKIQSKESEIASGEQSVRQAESSVNAAQNALQGAEKDVADAQLCAGLIGRRKRFLGNVWNSIQSAANAAGNAISSAANTAGNAISSAANEVAGAIVENVFKPVCSVINFQQVDNARRNVENKKNELSASRARVQTLKNDMNAMQNELVTFNSQVYNLYYQLTHLQGSLVTLPTEQHIIMEINRKLTSVVTFIRSSFGNAASFFEAMAAMTTFDSLIQPLNAIYDELQQNQFMTSLSTGKVSVEQFNRAQAGLQALAAAMVNVPINMGSINCAA